VDGNKGGKPEAKADNLYSPWQTVRFLMKVWARRKALSTERNSSYRSVRQFCGRALPNVWSVSGTPQKSGKAFVVAGVAFMIAGWPATRSGRD
jgi:hypothetical protein